MTNDIPDDVERAYQEALDYLYGYINLEGKVLDRYHASKMNPDRPRLLLEALGKPQDHYPTIHIAGTKGKGSVAAMCASIAREAGLRVGLYTSPHLREFRERIRILTPQDADGRISREAFVSHLDQVKPFLTNLPEVTWFEIVTALAFAYFAASKVDLAVIEVGLGGRLDATNTLTPLVAVITSLSLDHTNLLGDTLSAIASEKGGIIKPTIPVVSAPQRPQALATLLAIAAERNSPVIVVGEDWQFDGQSGALLITRSADETFVPAGTRFELALAGEHQLENATVALAALSEVRGRSFPGLDREAVRRGLAGVQWEGRLQTVHAAGNGPTLLVDAAHNEDSALKLRKALVEEYEYARLWLIFGAPADKAIGKMMRHLFPLAAGIILSAADHPRAADPTFLAQQAAALGFAAEQASDPEEALRMAWQRAEAGDLICATGSIIFVGDLLNQWESLKSALIA